MLNTLYVRQMPNPSALKGKVIVGTSIFDSAGEGFGDVSVLEDSIALPDGLKDFGASGFDLWKSLIHGNVPWSVKVIGNNAFSNCTLTDLQTIKGNDLEDIGQYAFATNTILDSFGLPFDPKAFDRYSFILRAKKIYAPWNNDNADASLLPKIDFLKKTYESDTLVVPKGSLNLYKSSETFSKFKNIMEE